MYTPSVVVVGAPGVGKTCLIHSLTKLSRDLGPTTQPEAYCLSRDNKLLIVWDTPGQDKYASFSKSLLEQATLVVSCSDTGKWQDPQSGTQGSDRAAVLRVRTKDDLGLSWFQADLATSSLTGSGVRTLFDALFELTDLAAQHTGSRGSPQLVGDQGCCCCFSRPRRGEQGGTGWPTGVKLTRQQLEEWRLELIYSV